MSLNAEQELLIRKAIAAKLATVANIGSVLPAPVYFNDKADFWATVAPKLTREEIETTPVKLCAIYPLQFVDSVKEGGLDEPLIYFTYEFYLFHERNYERNDETETPDAFNKELLKTHSDFVAVWLDARAEFLGKQYLSALPDDIFAVKQTNSLTQTGFINNDAICAFIPGVRGFDVRMQLVAKILLRAC